MKKLIKWISRYYGVSKSEVNGYVLLILLMFLMPVAMFWFKSGPKEPLKINHEKLDSLLLAMEENAFIDTISHKQRLPFPPRSDKPVLHREVKKRSGNRPKYSAKTMVKFDINKADTNQLKRLKGIGSVFSKRIIKYRELLGGFVTLDQLSEVYGLHDSVLMQLDTLVYVAADFNPSMINVNSSSPDELSRHPYLKKSVAGAISNYRYQHGKFSEAAELRNIQLLDSLTLAKITPYISF
ncbi:MAG: helix-hairpin-helix domain-containing protein [Bacteroidota bacterium]